MTERKALPLVGITCCRRVENDHPFHAVGQKYITAVTDAAGALPVLIPALGPRIEIEALLDRLDGIMITGSPSNVEPHLYGGEPSRPGTLHDPARDETTLPLLRAALARDLPVLAICRGIQELNVALGGSLHQLVHEVPGRRDHRSDKTKPTMAERYAHEAHPIRLTEGGLLHRLAGTRDLMINSLHAQGIDRLAPGLAVEAVAQDGQIEAVRVEDRSFAIGVQWHPEFAVLDHAFSAALVGAFGAACRTRATKAARAA